MIKNLVFDIGNVLISFQPEVYLDSFDFYPALRKHIFQTVFKSRYWEELDRGTITEEEALKCFCREAPEVEMHIKRVLEGWKDILRPIPGTIELLTELKNKGYKLFVLSNYHKAAFERTFSENDFFSLLDGKVISYEVKRVKPEREIYEHLLKVYGLKSGETLFIDDMEVNIRGAEQVGFHTILFQGADKLKADLKAINIL